MSSRKRWTSIYQGDDPFGIVRSVSEGLGQCCKQSEEQPDGKIKYLWMHLPESSAYETNGSEERPLSLDELLDIIDECASVGSQSLIISISSSFADHPHLFQLCDWAQATHGMVVGIHLFATPLTDRDAAALKKLDMEKVRLFVDGEHMDSAHFAEAYGFRVYNADGLDDEIVSPKCELPHTMTCVGPMGNMYTCGLVLGEQQFRLGHFFERKLSAVIDDSTLPHEIPEGVSKKTRRCNGCPPLMAQKLHDDVI